ncbi:calcium-binding protein 7 [Scomber scombrus]|uniref:Calcium-binding protein 7 n=2 Tax=Scomber TaxID=13675 RepID=A0AAV1NIS7_SCOSC
MAAFSCNVYLLHCSQGQWITDGWCQIHQHQASSETCMRNVLVLACVCNFTNHLFELQTMMDEDLMVVLGDCPTEMPVRAVTTRFMYKGLCTIPDVLTYRTPVNLPEDEVEEIREAFKVFDRDGNGFISKQELGVAMRSLGYMPNEVELEVIIQRLDMDGDGQVGFEEFVTLLGPKLSAAGMPDKFNGADFDSVFWKCDMQKLTVDELKRLLYDTFRDHLTMKDIENIIMTEESHLNSPESHVDIETSPTQQEKHTCVRKSLICAFAIAFIISVMLIAANQMLRRGMK